METKLEKVLMSMFKTDMINYMAAHPEDFEEAIKLAVTDKQPYSWRAAWLLWSCMEENDRRVKRHIKRIIESIKGKEDGHQRELLKILMKMQLNDEQEGALFNTCLTLWEKINSRPSVRYTAFQFILQTAKKYPELSDEISFLTQNHYLESLSPGAKKSVSRMIKEHKKLQKGQLPESIQS